MRPLTEWIYYFFNVLNFEDLVEWHIRKIIKCQKTTIATKLMIFSTILCYILIFLTLLFRSNLLGFFYIQSLRDLGLKSCTVKNVLFAGNYSFCPLYVAFQCSLWCTVVKCATSWDE